MQRAAASSPLSSPQQAPSLPSTKRQKLSHQQQAALSTPSSDIQAIQAALAAEEAKRSEALERQAAEAGETKWVLSFRDDHSGGAQTGTHNGSVRVITTGYSDIDHGVEQRGHDGEPWRPQMVGRRSFGKFNRALEVRFDTILVIINCTGVFGSTMKLIALLLCRNAKMATQTLLPQAMKRPKLLTKVAMMIAMTHQVRMR